MAYSVRGSSNPFGYMASANYSPDNYGRIVEGNAHRSYGPWVDPEIQRHPHLRRSVLAMHRRRRRGGY